MRVSNMLLAGAGALLIAGGAYAAERVHALDVALPDGSIEHIHYLGDTPPVVAFAPVERIALPVAFAPDPMFAAFDRMFADMDRQAAAMMRQAAVSPDPAVLGSLPAGTVSYSFYSASIGGQGGCTRSFQMTSYGAGKQPQVVRHTSGDCPAPDRPQQQVVAPADTAPAIRTIPVKADAPAPKKYDPRTI
ncbi:hypothetical protein F9288_11705 [Sphingomonas sp. CL5.1]|uniref:hypothetical protein n=1 Tax=Sphingomonas sp. CL5.1 TaxID=2653203 RepID=UPI0015828417|nr:hypothetical protein [Sphingomonas sp. CL5.1]QKS00215.1 hypothetical protein F9288_11705 [Sphingomonas sp. CL5.1]